MAVIKENTLTYEIYAQLRKSVGWTHFSEAQARNALKRTDYSVVVEEAGQPVGMARVIGDGMNFLILDVVVAPPFQGKGYGKRMLETILAHIESTGASGSKLNVQLFSAEGKVPFYEKLGFQTLPDETCGPGMRKIIQK